jgi:hypothetical protein
MNTYDKAIEMAKLHGLEMNPLIILALREMYFLGRRDLIDEMAGA